MTARLSNAELDELVALRRRLHREPEVSGRESATAARIAAALERLAPDALLTGLGGHGVAALLRGSDAAARPVILRCELDALPIDETVALPHGSVRPGVAHTCGHDGHMTMVVGAGVLQRKRRAAGDPTPCVVLLFQPAEETGAGAAAVVADGRLDAWSPAAALALHNVPGRDRGAIVVRDGTFACASCGARIEMRGAPSHASTPEHGRSPAPAVARLVGELPSLPDAAADRFALVTVVHAILGTPDFGIAPGEAVVMATLRAETIGALERLRAAVRERATAAASEAKVAVEITWHDEFPPTVNALQATAAVRAAAAAAGLPVNEAREPFRFSEDFAHLTARYGGAMFGLGAGRDHPPLHDVGYDFPDELIPIGATMLLESAGRLSNLA